MEKLIPVLSLVVAGLAVFFGPLLLWHSARRQVTLSLDVANKQITAPMRQTWINSLSDLLAELTSIGVVYVPEDQTHTTTRFDRMTHLQYRVLLMLNPKEQDHQKLEQLIKQMVAMARSFSEEMHLATTQG
jgi:ABC-type Mn2+/Zn2+ transport system ATPase subunit